MEKLDVVLTALEFYKNNAKLGEMKKCLAGRNFDGAEVKELNRSELIARFYDTVDNCMDTVKEIQEEENKFS